MALLFCALLAPIFYFMWIYQGTGNANFYYAINLVLAAIQTIWIGDVLRSILQDDSLQKKEDKKKQKLE